MYCENWSYITGCCPDGTPTYVCIWNEIISQFGLPQTQDAWIFTGLLIVIYVMLWLAVEDYNNRKD